MRLLYCPDFSHSLSLHRLSPPPSVAAPFLAIPSLIRSSSWPHGHHRGRETAAAHAHEARAAGPRRRRARARPAPTPTSCRRARASLSPSPASEPDKPVPSFLRPTVSSTLRSASPSSSTSRPPSSKGRATTPKGLSPAHPAARAPSPIAPKRSPAQQPASSPRPITPKRPPAQPVNAPRPITPAMDKAKAKPSTSRWSVASPRQLMQKASHAFKVGRSRSKKSKDLAGPAAEAVASAKESSDASGEINVETARPPPVPEQQRRPPEMTAATPLDVVQGEVVVEPNAALQVLQEAASRPGEIVSNEIKTEEEVSQEEEVISEETRAEAEKANAIDEEKVIPKESVEAVKVDEPALEENPQAGNVEGTQKEAENIPENEFPPPAAVVEEPSKEAATPLNVLQDEPAASPVQEEAVVETKAEERPQAEPAKHEDATKQPEASLISEEPKEQPAVTQKLAEAAEEPKMIAASKASSVPATSLEEALEEVDTVTKVGTSRSEPVTPAKQAINKEKAVIDTILSASEPTTPLKGAARKEGATSFMGKIPEEGRLSFKGSRVKTAMEKRPEEAHPKKEVSRSNDVLEETKSKLLEKKKSKVKALVGAFEVVMDSPRASTPGPGRSAPRF
ncbi:nascent polypeptide-associated complex subunit alpha, muscle-specific form-like [Triticum aestivum]|uniref:nascent polypeptide-associated complex subunit alpha, muscle-specific form-like n=1 Tax=Triticum aestivum TaxID=4565 RepID=UPI001D00B960|nr:nascent polypeptide-associated complex subunit alpha, muscle-specific form-like [Triticum aestivum]